MRCEPSSPLHRQTNCSLLEPYMLRMHVQVCVFAFNIHIYICIYIYIYLFISVCVYMYIDNSGINTSPAKTAAVGIEGERGGFAPKCLA